MKKITSLLAIMALSMNIVYAQVALTEEKISIDGKLDETAWSKAPVQSGFTRKQGDTVRKSIVPTEFRVLSDKDNIYIGITCKEPQMDQLKTNPQALFPWQSDRIEIFAAPTGLPDEYYQFVISAGNVRWCMYYGEGGVIRPDPYMPLWETAVHRDKDFWSLEVKIPLTAFYMTGTAQWRPQWLFNINRMRLAGERESTSWSRLILNNHDARLFKTLGDFPVRPAREDVCLNSVFAEVTDNSGDRYAGGLDLNFTCNQEATGSYSVQITMPDGKKYDRNLNLRSGANRIRLNDFEFPALGANIMKFEFRHKRGNSFGREYPVQVSYEPLKIALINPVYSNTFYPGQDNSRISGQVQVRMSPEKLAGATLEISLEGAETLNIAAATPVVKFNIDTPEMKYGKMNLAVTLRQNKKALATASVIVNNPQPVKTRMVWIENSRFNIDGEAVFARDMGARGYRGGEAFVDKFAELVPVLTLDKIQMVHLEPTRLVGKQIAPETMLDAKPSQIVFDKIRETIEKNRNRDFTQYKLSDEPECRNISPVYLKYLYDYVKELDPFHPVMISTREARRYLDCVDVFFTHPYINPVFDGKGGRLLTIPIHRVRDYVRAITRFTGPDKMAGVVPQCFSYGNLTNRMSDYPTFAEMESSTWTAIANGARTTRSYAYHDLGDRPTLFEGTRYICESIAALKEIIMKGTPLKIDAPEEMLDALYLQIPGQDMLLLVNLMEGEQKVTVSGIPAIKLQEFRGDRTFTPQNGKLELTLLKYEVLIMTTKPVGENLKSHRETVALIEKLEKERVSRGNVLAGKGYDIEIDSSNPNASFNGRLWQQNKLFDGTTDMQAWFHSKTKQQAWYELSFPKFVPKFSKARIFGNQLEGVSVRIWKAGEWLSLEPVATKTDKYMLEMDFGKTLSTVKFRINFAPPPYKKDIELYEIELLP